jgi:hypothetical protein
VDKEHILDEIKRTVAANGGHLLGEHAFYRETGIRKGDWFGKFWPKFSDAVKEAGFTPKQFRDEKQYSDDDMLARYAMLAQELGRIPAKGDAILKKRHDSDFPATNTYEARFGSKLELVAQLATYCASRPDYANVLEWSKNYISQNPVATSNEGLLEETTGYVYLMKMGKFYKVGRTSDVVRRGAEITILLPEEATTIHFFRTDDPSGIEAYWHNRFAVKRRKGEWFELSSKDIAAFKRRRSFM